VALKESQDPLRTLPVNSPRIGPIFVPEQSTVQPWDFPYAVPHRFLEVIGEIPDEILNFDVLGWLKTEMNKRSGTRWLASAKSVRAVDKK
jgi:hypothetical protein